LTTPFHVYSSLRDLSSDNLPNKFHLSEEKQEFIHTMKEKNESMTKAKSAFAHFKKLQENVLKSEKNQRESTIDWEEIILEGLKTHEYLPDVLAKAAKTAPEQIKKILKNFPESMVNLSNKDIEHFKLSKQGVVLLLLRCHLVSSSEELFRDSPVENQKDFLEGSAEASIEAADFAFALGEKEFEADYLLKAGNILYDLKRFGQAENRYNEALTYTEHVHKKILMCIVLM